MDISLLTWMGAMEESVQEFVTTTLEERQYAVLENLQQLPETIHGAFVYLTNERVEAVIGIFGEESDCLHLVRKFCALADADPVPEQEKTDTLGEIANILAGGVKLRMAGLFPRLRLSMPEYRSGPPQFKEALRFLAVKSIWGGMKISMAIGVEEKNEVQKPC
jgi:hypothetical protein